MDFKDVEQARKEYRAKLKTGRILALVFAALGAILGALLFSMTGSFSLIPAFSFAIFGLVIGLIFTAITTNKPRQTYQKFYKAYFVVRTLNNNFENLHYNQQQGLPKNLIKSTGMINTADLYISNDLALATYKNVKFAQSDATIKEAHTDSKGNTTYVTIFKGRIMIFEFKKKFTHRLELVGKRFRAYKIPGKNPKTRRKMQKFSTESTDFNKAFRIFAEDGFETFYLLDPTMIEKLQKIADRYNNKVLFGFLDNTLLVAINDGKDSFEPPKASKPLDKQVEQAKIDQDIKIITDFVDLLSLDRKFFAS